MVMLDKLVGNAEQFPILREWDFMNHAAVCPLPRVAANALRRYAEQAETQAYIDTGWYRDVNQVRDLCARMINAHRDEIALMKNTSEGLATVAGGLDWKAGDRIISTNVEFPANIYPWMELSRRHGVEFVQVPEETDARGVCRVSLERILEEAARPRTRMVALSHVEYASGQRHDLVPIGRFCRERGILFCVDAIQSMGVLPVDVEAMNIDYLAADGHKWLLGPEGAGIFYCRRELLAKTRPLAVGWTNVVNAADYGSYDYTLREDAQKFECGTWSVGMFLALKASMELLLGVGIEAVAQRVGMLTQELVAGLSKAGYRVVSPREEGSDSGIVSFVADNVDMPAMVQRLRKEFRTEIACREGRIRVSPHFYNTSEQTARLVERLGRM